MSRDNEYGFIYFRLSQSAKRTKKTESIRNELFSISWINLADYAVDEVRNSFIITFLRFRYSSAPPFLFLVVNPFLGF